MGGFCHVRPVALGERYVFRLDRFGAPGVLGEDGQQETVELAIEPPGCNIVHRVDLGLDARRHLEKFEIIRWLFARH